MKLEVPLSEDLAGELHGFWERIFVGPGDMPIELFLGGEQDDNHNTVYLERRADRLAGTCNLTVSMAVPTLGAFGEVATEPEFRGAGIATRLCRAAVEDFRGRGGQALFLGTGNGDAARIYRRLGWSRLAGTSVWANISGPESAEEFLVDYFRTVTPPITVAPATPAVRVPMIPLIVTPHDWQVLDSNAAGMLSTRHRLQSSCMGLYRKYAAVARDGDGAWFAARAVEGQVVGLSTARLDDSGGCRIDGFTHWRFSDSWDELIGSALDWSASRGASRLRVLLSVEDEDKRARFERLGFREVGTGDDFDLGGDSVGSVWLEKG